MKDTILVVDDDPTTQLVLKTFLEQLGCSVETAGSAKELEHWLEEQEFDLVLLDIQLPDGDGLQLIENVQEALPDAPVIIITAHGSVESAVKAMRNGAYDFFTKPFDSIDSVTVKNALERKYLKEGRKIRVCQQRRAV